MPRRIAGSRLNVWLLIGLLTISFANEIQAQTQVPAAAPAASTSAGVTPLGIAYAPDLGSLVTSSSDFHNRLQEIVGLQIHGMLVGTYEYNFDRPSTGTVPAPATTRCGFTISSAATVPSWPRASSISSAPSPTRSGSCSI